MHKLQAVVTTFPPTNRSSQTRDRRGAAQGKFQFMNLSNLKFRTKQRPETTGTHIKDSSPNHTDLIVCRARNQAHVILKSLSNGADRTDSLQETNCSASLSFTAHGKPLSRLYQQLLHIKNALMKPSGKCVNDYRCRSHFSVAS